MSERQIFRGVSRRDDPAMYVAAFAIGIGLSALMLWLRGILSLEIAPPIALVFLIVGAIVSRLSRVFVAADGVGTGSPFRRRFVPFSSVESVLFLPTPGSITKNPGGTILLKLHGGKEVRLNAAKINAGAVFTAIERAFAAHRGKQRSSFDAHVLDRGGSAPRDWLSRLRALAPSITTFREGAPSPAELSALVDDVRADETQRVAAAVILAQNGSKDDHGRMRVVAASTASPRLRVAIEAALDAREEALVEALQEIGVPHSR